MLVPHRADVTQPDGLYEDQYSCFPPPVGMVIISLVEIIFYCVDAAKGSTVAATGPMATALIYDPKRRFEAWRYLTYMFVHIG